MSSRSRRQLKDETLDSSFNPSSRRSSRLQTASTPIGGTSRAERRKATPPRPRPFTPPRVRSRSRSRSRSRDVLRVAGPLNMVGIQRPAGLSGSRQTKRSLDVQSDDEDDTRGWTSTQRVAHVNGGQTWKDHVATLSAQCQVLKKRIEDYLQARAQSFPKSKSVMKTAQEYRWFLLAAILLLFIIFIHKLAQQLTSESEADKVVVILACFFAPFRQLVESVKMLTSIVPAGLWKGAGVSVPASQQFTAGPSHHLPGQLDYEELAAKILDHAKFREMVESISDKRMLEAEETVSRLNQAEVTRLHAKIDQIGAEAAKQSEAINQTKKSVKEDIQQALHEINSLSKAAETQQASVMDHLRVNMQALEEKINALANSPAEEGTKVDLTAELKDLEDLKSKVSALENSFGVVSSSIKSCCSKDYSQIIQEKIESLLDVSSQSGLFDRLTAILAQQGKELVTQEQFREELARIESLAASQPQQASELTPQHRQMLLQQLEANIDQMKEEIVSEVNLLRHQRTNKTRVQKPDSEAQVEEEIVGIDEVEFIVKKALAKYDADKTGLFDFALESAGGSILTTRCTENYELSSAVMSVFGIPFWWEINSPRSIIQPGSAPGQCWSFKGSQGTVVVKLSAEIAVRAVSIEHISHVSTPDGKLASAPKNMTVSGVRGEESFPLINFTYSIHDDPVQTFWLHQPTAGYDTVELNIHSNHGHPEYTCLYRFRVHGKLLKDVRLH